MDRNYNEYLKGLDSNMINKINIFVDCIENNKNVNVVHDIGCGSGKSTYELARKYPNMTFFGFDISPQAITHAKQKYRSDNINFLSHNVYEKLQEENIIKSDFVICSSILHELYSYAPIKLQIKEFNILHQVRSCYVYRALKNIYDATNDNGTILIRDFVSPPEPNIIVNLYHYNEDLMIKQKNGKSFEDYVELVKKRNLYEPLLINKSEQPNFTIYMTNMKTAYEYIFRKDYFANWHSELEELYSFFSKEEYIEVLKFVGFSDIKCEMINNDWIIKNRLKDKIKITDISNKVVDYKYQIIITAKKFV